MAKDDFDIDKMLRALASEILKDEELTDSMYEALFKDEQEEEEIEAKQASFSIPAYNLLLSGVMYTLKLYDKFSRLSQESEEKEETTELMVFIIMVIFYILMEGADLE